MSGESWIGLPEELWRRILELGLGSGTKTEDGEDDSSSSSSSKSKSKASLFNYKDVCCVSMTCRLLNRLSGEDSIWSFLLSSDFPHPPQIEDHSTRKKRTLYITRFKKDKERKMLAHRRAVLRVESQIAQHQRNLQQIQLKADEEANRFDSTLAELTNLRRSRQASVALNVWQPEVIHDRLKQVVQQCSVPVESRINVLQMELKLCELQISAFHLAHKEETQRLEAAKNQLSSLNYHPLQAAPAPPAPAPAPAPAPSPSQAKKKKKKKKKKLRN